jgi:HlyD family secretion protein
MARRLAVAVVVLVVLGAGAAALRADPQVLQAWWRGSSERTVTVTSGPIRRIVVAIGRVEPLLEVTLANKIPGRIKAVLVKEGDPVRIGQPIIRFDDAEAQAQVRLARARVHTAEAEMRRAARGLETARARWIEVKSGARAEEIEAARAEVEQTRQKWDNLELDRRRFKQLLDAAVISRAEYDRAEAEAFIWRAKVRATEEQLKLLLAGPKPETVAAAWTVVQEAEADVKRAEAQVVQARAELAHAQAQLASTVVDSTVNGKVTRKIVEPGEAVDISMPLIVLGDVRKIIVKAEVDETEVGKLALGLPAEVTADAYPGRIFRGRIYEIGQAVGKRRIRPEDPAKIQDMKVLETKIEIQEGAEELKLGMTVDVTILAENRERAVRIPRRVVPGGAREALVQVAGPSGRQPRRIRLGLSDGEHVEVLTGLVPGEQVVLAAGR